MQIVIIGAVAGGASAAARARRLSEDAEIILVERGEAPSFANCGLPYYIGGVIENRKKLLVAPAQMLIDRLRLDVRTQSEALTIDRANHVVRIRYSPNASGETSEYDLHYDKLILSPGAAPIRPPIPGIDLPGVYTLRDLRDADRLHAAVQGARRAVIIGGGFIGIEMAENFVHRGLETTVVELADQILPPWDPEMVASFADHLRKQGMTINLSDAAESIASRDSQGPPEEERADGSSRLTVRLRSGDQLPADLVVLAVGVRPENRLAVDAGLPVGARGGILVNEHMQTADPDVYAVGDAVEVRHAIDGSPTQIPLAGPANRQGRIAADHIFGRPSRYRGTQGTAIVGAFGMTAAMTGFSEKALRAASKPCLKAYIHPASHAGYYPGAEGMSLKVLFAPDNGRLLGAQAVGRGGVDKRIDVLAVALQAGMTVYDLEEAELAYAPQFGSAKDPVNMLGFVAAGILRGDHPPMYAEELSSNPLPSKGREQPSTVASGDRAQGGSPRTATRGGTANDAFILDVRSPAEFSAGHLPHAVNIPIDELRARLDELPRDRPIAAYCQVGLRGYLATRLLAQRGFDVRNLSGGYLTYRAVESAREKSPS